MFQPNSPPRIYIRVLLILLSVSVPSLANAQSQKTYTCQPNPSVPKNLIPISKALKICGQVNALSQGRRSERITQDVHASSSLLLHEKNNISTLTNQVEIYKLNLTTKQTGTLEISAAIIGIVGGVGGGVLKLKNMNTAAAWMGIAAGGAGGALAVIKGWSDYNKCGKEIKEYMGEYSPAMHTYIVATNPREFRALCRNPDPGTKLTNIMAQMTKDYDALQNQFGIR